MKRIVVITTLMLAMALWTCGYCAQEPTAPAQQQKSTGAQGLTFEKFVDTKWLSDLDISPDGRYAVFCVKSADVKNNSYSVHIWRLDIKTRELRRLTTAGKKNLSPTWSRDGSKIAFTSDRDGVPQVYCLYADGGEAAKITDLSTGADGPVWSPDGKSILFASSVYPGLKGDGENKKKLEEVEKSKVKAEVFEGLPYRIWNSFREGKVSHLFIAPAPGGETLDLTPGRFDVPPLDLGGYSDYCFAPGGEEVSYVQNIDPQQALSTNNDIFTVSPRGGNAVKITSNPACDNQPVYSPNGKYIAYRAMKRPGFEADRQCLMLRDRKTGTVENLTEELDRTVDEIAWAPDSESIYFNVEDEGYRPLCRVFLKSRHVHKLTEKAFVSSPRPLPDGKNVLYFKESIRAPKEVFILNLESKVETKLTGFNDDYYSLDLKNLDEFWFSGSRGYKVHGLMMRPPGFDPAKKYPVLFLIHGGPQGAWSDDFHPRWNISMFASAGFVVVMVNPRGSVGYGQQFVDEVSGDWGGKAYDDLMMGLDYALRTYPYLDEKRMAAAGASYGGYMVNWFAGHTQRFRCLVSHSGVFNVPSMYGSTEELWFPEWEFKGTPWTNSYLYERYSPHNYVEKFKTPTLVVHGQLDYRVPITEGLQMFTALQRRGIPSKFLYFPDEGHFITKPQNSGLWYGTVIDWLKEWTK